MIIAGTSNAGNVFPTFRHRAAVTKEETAEDFEVILKMKVLLGPCPRPPKREKP